uniref:Uncharacterized protein n=1 Tax=Cacopsylla melanoneura TaxID=428564 RepID=A0A8D9AFM9_9HEMI
MIDDTFFDAFEAELSDEDTIVSDPDSDSDSDTLQPPPLPGEGTLPLSRSHSSSTINSNSFHTVYSNASHVSRNTTRSMRSHHSWRSDDVSQHASESSNASFRSAVGCKQHHSPVDDLQP